MDTQPTKDTNLKNSKIDKDREIELFQEKMADMFFDMWQEKNLNSEQNCYNENNYES